MIGIYRIKNLVNNKCYYGSSKNIEKRWLRHKNELNKKTHINCVLQRAWDKYGEDNFLFEIVEECDSNILLEVEQKYLDTNPDYNIAIKSSGGDNLSRNPKKDEIIKKITNSVKKRYDSMTKEEKQKYSQPMELNPNWKGGITYQYCECGKRIGTGHKHCNKCRPRSDDKNPFFNKTHSEETKKKLRERMLGSIPNNRKEITINNIDYVSYNDASEKLGIPITTIRWRVLSKNPKYKDYHFMGEKKICFTDEEQKIRFSKPQKNKKRNHNKPFLIDNIEYQTLKDASKKLKIHQMTIKGRLLSSKFDNYKYKD